MGLAKQIFGQNFDWDAVCRVITAQILDHLSSKVVFQQQHLGAINKKYTPTDWKAILIYMKVIFKQKVIFICMRMMREIYTQTSVLQ